MYYVNLLKNLSFGYTNQRRWRIIRVKKRKTTKTMKMTEVRQGSHHHICHHWIKKVEKSKKKTYLLLKKIIKK